MPVIRFSSTHSIRLLPWRTIGHANDICNSHVEGAMQNNHEDGWICNPHSVFSVMNVYLDTRQMRERTWGITLNVYIVESLHSLRLRDAVVGSKYVAVTPLSDLEAKRFVKRRRKLGGTLKLEDALVPRCSDLCTDVCIRGTRGPPAFPAIQ